MTSRKLLAFGLILTGVAATAACSDEEASTSTSATRACDVTVDRFKELAIVDEGVVDDARAKNATNGTWSFRHLFETMAPTGKKPSEFVTAWLEDWGARKTLNNYSLDRESREQEMQNVIVCPWLRRTPANQCDDTCSSCVTRELDLAQAPFRLRAIMNRFDVREDPDAVGPAGELRFLFGLFDGAADDPAAKPLGMSVIVEYMQPKLGAKGWAEKWHALGAHPAFDESYKADLQAITDAVTAPGAAPERQNGSALAQVRSNESALNWIWQLREFSLDSSGQLALSPPKNTPAEAFNGGAQLVQLIQQNASTVKANKFVVPGYMLGASVDQFLFRWNLPGLDEGTRLAFSRHTCNGCHGDNPTIDVAFHVSPYRSGTAKLSLFLNNPADTKHDELARREESLRNALCAP